MNGPIFHLGNKLTILSIDEATGCAKTVRIFWIFGIFGEIMKLTRRQEEKGLVTSKYQLAADKNGPGRTECLFYPGLSNEKRKEMLANEIGGRFPGKEEHKQMVMTKLRSGEFLA
jgi:hypothetical protein